MRSLIVSQALKFGSRPIGTRTMALHSAQDPSKLIFAPAGKEAHGQAEQFNKGTLTRLDLDAHSPVAQFHAWFAAAQQASVPVEHPETCCLSTASLPSGRVSARMVYLKELDGRGFVVYSNFGTSRKSKDLASNPWASLTFWWEAMERQVRVEGRAERLSAEESQKYYDTRARGSRIGAWASRQSQVLQPMSEVAGTTEQARSVADDGRQQLEGWVKEVEDRFEGQEQIPVPEFWGGLRIVPESVEFWQGRQSRLHDRFMYTRKPGSDDKPASEAEWVLERLSP
ncbi:pyridoxamine 5'-phosphate oxidase [Microdochium trichocladiopsis]|uniref:pyridoxal 5'-phosphate synthase n=1 Tax=Microdochium trichocladiopsis TaxID=1682393 RepID=A0A9P9BT55_9PEZI|nr:pyridoxamine 5'-phosphate oxidase [Microdochium trichocladiopsis]KAH7035595.1 pyridoxamine 5'-phosphate oxidase [Microdochium trichocladiopsis]